MTEEIIIDGVDVAGCRLYLNGNGKCLRLLTDDEPETECNAICDYGCLYHKEQLKRLEQENKSLHAYKDINEDFKKAWDELNEKYRQLRSALEEILESANFAQCLPCGSGNLEDCLNCNDDTTNNGQFCMEKRIHEIKTKCVEVLQ